MHFPAVRMIHRRARRDQLSDLSNLERRQFAAPTTAVVPNVPVRPTVITRATVTETVVVPPRPTPPRPPNVPVLTPVRPELSGVATTQPTGATPGVSPPVSRPAQGIPAPGAPTSAPSLPATTNQPPPAIPSPEAPVVQSPAPTTSSTPVRIISTPLSSPATSPIPSDASNAQGSTAKGPSSAVIGVIAGIVALGLVCAAAFFVRRRFLRRRQNRRNTWGAGFYNDRRDAFKTDVPVYEKPAPQLETYQPSYQQTYQPPAPPKQQAPIPNPYDQYPTQPYMTAPAPPPMSYNNPQDAYRSPPSASHALPSPAPGPIARGATDAGAVTVLRVFIPSLPDELHISAGEKVRIINAYDDGWALCANNRGEQGVVPLECLDRPQANPAPQGGDWRNLKRTSSLYSTGGAPTKGY